MFRPSEVALRAGTRNFTKIRSPHPPRFLLYYWHVPHRVNRLTSVIFAVGSLLTLVPFTKTAETEDGLIAKLSARGLVFSDESELRSLLRTVGYYRMSGYLHSF